MSALNRRSILTGAAAVPIAAVTGDAVAAPTSTETQLLELERQAAAAEAAAVEAGRSHTEAEEAMLAWKRRNPEPELPVSTLPPDTLLIGQLKCLPKLGGAPDATIEAIAKMAGYLLGAEPKVDLESVAKHREALNSWNERHRAALAKCFFEEREAEFERLIDRADAIRDEAASIPAITIDGLRCKARMLSQADLIAIGESGLLADSIIDELRADLQKHQA